MRLPRYTLIVGVEVGGFVVLTYQSHSHCQVLIIIIFELSHVLFRRQRDHSEKSEGEAPSVGEHSCQICFEHDHSTVMLPCGHGGVCWDCGIQMYALTEECPMCREKINLVSNCNLEEEFGDGPDVR